MASNNHSIYLNIAQEISKLSKCVSYKVGAVIVSQDGRIISTGYNGTPGGYENCCDVFGNYVREEHRQAHTEYSDLYEIHAELNSIVWAARRGNSIEGCHMYVTHQPCWNCSKNIIQSGITHVFYRHEYDRIANGSAIIEFYSKNNVQLTHVKT